MVGEGLRGLPHVDALSPSDKIYQGVNQDGWLLLRSSLVYHQKESTYALTERHLVALALTEICCDIGRGKVYYFPLPLQRELDSRKNASDSTKFMTTLHRFPKLIYIPFVWGEEDKAVWRAMKHSDRLAILNARGGGISPKVFVMPIDLIYDEIEKKTIRVNGYTTNESGCMATLAVVPKAYVGWIPQFQKDAKRFEFSGQGFDDGLAWHVTDHEILVENGCAMSNAEEVVAELWKMVFAGKERSLIKFEDLLRAIIDFSTVWYDVNG